MRKHLTAAAAAALVLGIALVAACSPPPPGPGTTPSTTTSTSTTVPATDLTGRIVDSITGEPVPGASVLLTNITGIPLTGAPGPVGTYGTASDASGDFSIAGVPAHFYISVGAPGFESGLTYCIAGGPYFRSVEQVFTGACLFATGSAGTIPLDSLLPHTFGGVVRDSLTLLPVAGAKVVLADNAGNLSDSAITFTNGKGEFSLTAATGVDDLSVYVDGSGVAHDSGYVGCDTLASGDRKTVASFADGCTYAPVRMGNIGLAPI